MSDEEEKLIEETFITKLGAKYAFVKAKACNAKYKVQGFPTVVVIGPDGTVKYNDNPAPSETLIEELLKNVSLAPKLPDDAKYAPVKSMWEKRDYVKLRDYLDKMLAQPNLDAEMRTVFEAQKAELTRRAEAQTTRIGTLGQGPDYAEASDQIERIEKAWRGFPVADAAKKELARFAADAAIKKELAAGKALQKLVAGFDLSREQEVKKLIAELQKFTKKYEGTYAAKQAEEQRQKLLDKK